MRKSATNILPAQETIKKKCKKVNFVQFYTRPPSGDDRILSAAGRVARDMPILWRAEYNGDGGI